MKEKKKNSESNVANNDVYPEYSSILGDTIIVQTQGIIRISVEDGSVTIQNIERSI